MIGIVPIVLLAQIELFAALSNNSQSRVGYPMPHLRGRGMAVEANAWQRLHISLFADGPIDTLHQLVSVGLRPLLITLCLLRI